MNSNPNNINNSNPNIINDNPNNINKPIDQMNKSDQNIIQPLQRDSEKPNIIGNLNLRDDDDQKNLLGSNKINPKDLNLINKNFIRENKIQKEFKNIFKGNDYFENNYYRKRVMYLTLFCVIVDILHLQILWYKKIFLFLVYFLILVTEKI